MPLQLSRNQLFDLLPGVDFRQQLRLEHFPETDHVVSGGPGRTRLLDAMAEWMTQKFPHSTRSRTALERVTAVVLCQMCVQSFAGVLALA